VRRVVIVPVMLAAAVLLGACGSSGSSKGGGASNASTGGGPYGGGSSSQPSATSSAGAATTGATVNLSAKDFAFTPTALTVAAGGGTVKFTNTGSVEHNFTVDGKGISKDAEAGDTATVRVDLPAGTYQFHCKYHPTQMKGTLTVG
jgi:plastocyanin